MNLKIKDIKFYYENFSLAVDVEIGSGEFISILGPSGSGKTTLLRLLAGFQTPSTGSIELFGREITDLPTASRNIGMVFQDYALFPHLDVFHNIAYGLKTKKMSKTRIKSKVSELLELVSLSEYQNRHIDELSGGEMQRVALARAIAPEPELLLFDEPLSALDVKLRKSLRREIKQIQKRLGFTAVYVTHDQEEAMSISDRIAVMNNGRICQIGSPEDLYNKPVDFFTADFIGIMNRIHVNGDIMFRPEACRINTEGESDFKNCLELDVTLSASEYSGGYYQCESLTQNNEVLIFYSDDKIDEGSKLSLAIDKNRIIHCE